MYSQADQNRIHFTSGVKCNLLALDKAAESHTDHRLSNNVPLMRMLFDEIIIKNTEV